MDILLDFFVWMHLQFIGVMQSIVLELQGFRISLFDIVIGCIMTLTILAIFWKGARA